MELEKINHQEIQLIHKLLTEYKCEDWLCVGKIFVYNEHFCKIHSIESRKYGMKGEEIDKVFVQFYWSTNLGRTWSSYGSDYIDTFLRNHPKEHFLTTSIEEYMVEVEKVISGEIKLSDYKDGQEDISETSLINVRSKEYLSTVHKSMTERKNKAELIAKGIKIEIERRKHELDAIRSSLGLIVADFKNKMDKIEKVIYTIELYLGINEDVVQIQEGTLASSNATIHFWQKKLFMDEEVGNPENDRLDFKNIEDFDSWLLEYSNYYKCHNYELMIPQQKGLCIFGVRSTDKKYSDNPFVNSMLNNNNHKTYILIRNGTSIFRIWGDIMIHKLFPDKERLSKMKEIWDWLDKKEQQTNSTRIGSDTNENIPDEKYKNRWGTLNTEEEKRLLDEEAFRYKQYFLMLQGLLDRTEVFYPLVERVEVMNVSAQDKGYVKFVYADEGLKISDGKLNFSDYMDSLNSQITEGSRVLYLSKFGYIKKTSRKDYDFKDRLDRRFNSYNQYRDLPSGPSTGIYTVSKYITEEKRIRQTLIKSLDECPSHLLERAKKQNCFPCWITEKDVKGNSIYDNQKDTFLCIYYNPGDTVKVGWNYWDDGHERKNRLSYKIFIEDDNDLINYDLIDLEQINFYLYDRRHRKDYLKIMPFLYELKKRRETELKEETEFVKGLIIDMIRNNQKIENPKQTIWDAIDWWKMKNKTKRPLTLNDSLAWKQIKNRLHLNDI